MSNKKEISLFYPSTSKNAIKNLKPVLESKWITEGKKVALFEKKIGEMIGNPYVVMTNSGTAALHIILDLLDLKEGDEVITPCFSCVATQFPLLWKRTRPVFADIDPKTLNISPEDVRRRITSKTKAIMVVHLSGQPANMDELQKIAYEHNIPIVEDAAQALGAKYGDRMIGSLGNLTMFSLQSVKSLHCGNGGIIMCRNEEEMKKAKRLRWFGISREKREGEGRNAQNYDITEMGYKYNPTDIDATIALANLEEFDKWMRKRKFIVEYYRENLKTIDGLYNQNHIRLQSEEPNAKSANWLFHIFVPRREDFIKKMKEAGIEVGISHTRNDFYSIFGGIEKGKFVGMDRIEPAYCCLPLHPFLSSDDLKYICDTIKGGW